MSCSPIESPDSSTASSSQGFSENDVLETIYSPTHSNTPCKFDSEREDSSNQNDDQNLNRKPTATTDDDVDDDDENDTSGGELLNSSYEDSVVKAYQMNRDLDEEEEVHDRRCSIDNELPILESVMNDIEKFRWNDDLPLFTPFVPKFNRGGRRRVGTIVPRKLEHEVEGVNVIGRRAEDSCSSPNLPDNEETRLIRRTVGGKILPAVPESEEISNLPLVNLEDYRRLQTENLRLQNRIRMYDDEVRHIVPCLRSKLMLIFISAKSC